MGRFNGVALVPKDIVIPLFNDTTGLTFTNTAWDGTIATRTHLITQVEMSRFKGYRMHLRIVGNNNDGGSGWSTQASLLDVGSGAQSAGIAQIDWSAGVVGISTSSPITDISTVGARTLRLIARVNTASTGKIWRAEIVFRAA